MTPLDISEQADRDRLSERVAALEAQYKSAVRKKEIDYQRAIEAEAKVAELEKRLAEAKQVIEPFAAYAYEPDLVPTISEYIAARDWITAQEKTDADHG